MASLLQDMYTNYVCISVDRRARLSKEEFDHCRLAFDTAGGICCNAEVRTVLTELGQHLLPSEFEGLCQQVGYRDGEFLRIEQLVEMLEILKLDFWLDANDPTVETVNAFVAVGGEGNGEGEVNQEDLFGTMMTFGLHIDETKKLAEEIDQNGDGTLDFDEFAALFTNQVLPKKKQAQEEAKEEPVEVKKEDNGLSKIAKFLGAKKKLAAVDAMQKEAILHAEARKYQHGSAFKRKGKKGASKHTYRRNLTHPITGGPQTRLFPHTEKPKKNLQQLKLKMKAMELLPSVQHDGYNSNMEAFSSNSPYYYPLSTISPSSLFQKTPTVSTAACSSPPPTTQSLTPQQVAAQSTFNVGGVVGSLSSMSTAAYPTTTTTATNKPTNSIKTAAPSTTSITTATNNNTITSNLINHFKKKSTKPSDSSTEVLPAAVAAPTTTPHQQHNRASSSPEWLTSSSLLPPTPVTVSSPTASHYQHHHPLLHPNRKIAVIRTCPLINKKGAYYNSTATNGTTGGGSSNTGYRRHFTPQQLRGALDSLLDSTGMPAAAAVPQQQQGQQPQCGAAGTETSVGSFSVGSPCASLTTFINNGVPTAADTTASGSSITSHNRSVTSLLVHNQQQQQQRILPSSADMIFVEGSINMQYVDSPPHSPTSPNHKPPIHPASGKWKRTPVTQSAASINVVALPPL